MNRLVLIDTANFFHRAFYAFPMQLTTADGAPINAVYGFAAILISLVEELAPTHLAAALESEKEPVFREIEFPDYKATRVPKPPEEQIAFDAQIPLLLRFLSTAKVPVFAAEGFEADDVIGTIAKRVISDPATEVIIASNDRDLMQLIGGRIRFYLPAVGKQKSKMYGEKEFFEEFGFPPEQLVDYKALRGDPSDNIPGVRGIGEKTGSELIRRYGTLENVYRNVLELKPAVVDKLQANKDNAALSKRLATIVTDVPIETSLEEFRFAGFDRPEVRALFKEWGFRSLLEKMKEEGSTKESTDQMKLI